MPKRRPAVSDDVVRLNPQYAQELGEGDWESQAERKRPGKEDKDKKDLFLKALQRFAPTIPIPIGQGGSKSEFRPIPGRAHKVDWAWPDWKVVVEVDGGNMGVARVKKGRNAGRWIPTGRHTKDTDYWKMNEITALGYTAFRFTTTQLRDEKTAEECVSQVRYFLKSRGFIR